MQLPIVGKGVRKQIPTNYSSIFVISDEEVLALYGEGLGEPLVVPAGEAAKELAVAERLWKELLDRGADRQSLLVALGGGSVGDLVGFTAATFMRGIDYVQVPTTMLAMVDASVGGKTAINLSGAKNIVGALHHPVAILADTECLKSLPPRHFWAGMAEVIKIAAIADGDLFELLEERIEELPDNEELLTEVIRLSAGLKLSIVREDPEDRGRRGLLNWGHTFAHAIEAASSYGICHGEAVAMGIHLAAHLSVDLGLAPESFAKRQDSLCRRAQLSLEHKLDPDAILAQMVTDKKRVAGKLRLVVAEGLGQGKITENVSPETILSSLKIIR